MKSQAVDKRNYLTALLYMVISIFLYSLFPVVGVFGTNEISGFVFAGFGHLISAALSIFGALLLTKSLEEVSMLRLMQDFRKDRVAFRQAILSGVINYLSHAFLFVSFAYISKSSATIIFEAWPVLAVFFLAKLTRRPNDKAALATTISKRVYFLSFVAFLGLAVIVLGDPNFQSSQDAAKDIILTTDGQIGLLFAALSAVFMSYSVALGRNTRVFVEQKYGHCEGKLSELNRALIASAATKAFGAFGFFATIPFLPRFASSLSHLSGASWGWIAFNGVFIVTLGSLSYREALARSHRIELAILWYTTPVFALIWLWLAGVEALSLSLGVGATLIISANSLLHMRADTTPAFIGVFLSIAVAGTVVTMTSPQELSVYLERASLVDLVALPVGLIGILGGFLLQRVNQLHSQAQYNVMFIVDYLKSQNQHPTLKDITNLVEDRHSLPSEIQHHARSIKLGEIPVIRPGELLVMWMLSIFCMITIILFRVPNVLGDALAILTTASLTYILLHLSFDARIRPNEVIQTMLKDDYALALRKQSRWALILICIVGLVILVLSHLGHIIP